MENLEMLIENQEVIINKLLKNLAETQKWMRLAQLERDHLKETIRLQEEIIKALNNMVEGKYEHSRPY